MKYNKPHKTYAEQVEILRSKGLDVPDQQRAEQLLSAVGYYRLSAYVYPFREVLPVAERTPGHTRGDRVMPGVSIDHVRALWEFDRHLRLLVLDATEVIEVGLRTRIAYVLGHRDTFGHVHETALDQRRCNDRRTVAGETLRAFDQWMARYADLVKQARNEDYVVHNQKKYDESPLAVWVAMELLDFGASVRLFHLMQEHDRNEIARGMGFTTGAKLYKVLLTCSNTRNPAAHHARLWNRPPQSTPPKIYASEVGADLAGWDSVDRNFMYAPLLLMAYLVRHVDPTSHWPTRARTRLKKFPDVPHLNINQHMGFPQDWADLPVWKDQPRG